MQVSGTTAVPPAISEPRVQDDPAKVKDAAQQFEALLLGQILKDISASSGNGSLGEPDAASSSMLEMANESFARAIAARGGLGLAGMVVRDLAARPATVSTNASEGQLNADR